MASVEPNWSDLPMEILGLVASRLPLSAHPRFASVCKRWMLCSSLVYPADHPLLMICMDPKAGKLSYYSPYLNKIFTTPDNRPTVDLSRARFRSAKHGWVLLSRSSSDIILMNPLSGDRHDIPALPAPDEFQNMAFSDPSLGSDFMIFAIKSHFVAVSISLYRGGNWSPIINYTSQIYFSSSNPVFCSGLFYCLGNQGELGVDKPEPVELRDEQSRYLTELDGELFMIEYSDHCIQMEVFMLNQDDGVWEAVHSLGSRMLLIGWPTSILVSAPATTMENKIYF